MTSALLALGCASLLGCAKSAAAPNATPATIVVDAGNNQTGTAGQPLVTPLAVRVSDAEGKPVKDRRVDWDIGASSGMVLPASSTTNASGIATTIWTAGPVATTIRVSAQLAGLNPAVFTAVILPGAPVSVVATPEAATLGVGDTIRVRASLRDALGNTIVGQVITFSTLDAERASVSSTGLVTALAQGTARIVADASGRADTVPVTIGAPGTSLCGGASPITMALGEVSALTAGATSISACVTAPTGVNAEYGLVVVNTAGSFGTGAFVDVLAIGNTGPTIASLTAQDALGSAAAATTDLPIGGAIDDRNAERAAELARQEIAHKELTPLVPEARRWYASRGRTSALVAANVGDELKLNVNSSQSCSNPSTRTGRIAALSNRAMIVSDLANPAGGYTDAEYQSILATFDTLVFPMDTAAFGAPTNISPYGRLILFYTKAVNELTPRNANFTIGGFFFARDLYPKKAANGLAACAASNENEMFYLLAPDPTGEVNGNRRTKDEVTQGNLASIAHELQHLINASRRLYVNSGAVASEETWLDEGLAHIAEELLYFRIAGYGSRVNLTSTDVFATTARQAQFNTYASLNFFRFQRYLVAPESNSPYAPNDSLATRGAIWNFLRFAAGRQGAEGEAEFFRRLVNARSTGVANLQTVLSSGGFSDYLLDWVVSLIADDFSPATTAALQPRYINPAWNFRAIFPGLRVSSGAPLGTYPIAARLLTSSAPQRIVLGGGTSSFVRFGIPDGRSAFITFSSNGVRPAATIRAALVRLR
jgi:hypothetical protein